MLERREIAALSVHSVPELIARLAGAGIAQRGAFGVQADAQLRGATFEQLVVLVNGVRVNDPQTGHFHLDLPLPIEVIERVEVLLGPGSAVHGSDAFGGVIAITTGAPKGPSVRLGGGQHRLATGAVTTPLGSGFWLSAERFSAAGFRRSTELSQSRGAIGWQGESGSWRIQANLAGEGKKFGAWSFYSASYPNQREEVETGLLTAMASRSIGAAELSVRLGARQHRDYYLLDRARPEWYSNRHRSRSGLAQVVLSGTRGAWAWSIGSEGERQLLASSRLGDHERVRAALFGEAAWSHGRVSVAAQTRGDHMSDFGWQLSPGLSIEVDIGRDVILAAHRARSFRVPSYTELYYTSPATVGNPGLDAEQAWSDELLLRTPLGSVRWELAAFDRRADGLIDYLRGDDQIWRARNYARVRTRGVEAAALLGEHDWVRGVRLSAAYLDSTLDVDPTRSRYALAHPRFEAGLLTTVALPLELEATTAVRWRRPQTRGSYALVDLRLARPLTADLLVELEAHNALDRDFQEIDGVPMPGRWLSLALSWRPQR